MLDADAIKLVLVISLFLLMGFSLLVAIKYSRSNNWLYFMIPIILMLSISTKTGMDRIMGYPLIANTTEHHVYIHHMVGINKEWIYVWAIEHKISPEPRSYKIEYTKKREKQLAEAKQAQNQGIPQGILLPPQLEGPESSESQDETLQLYNFNRLEGYEK